MFALAKPDTSSSGVVGRLLGGHRRPTLWGMIKLPAVIGSVLFVSIVAIIFGMPVVPVALVGVIVAFWALVALPLDTLLPIIVFLATGLNNPLVTPHEGKYSFLLDPIGKLLFRNLPIKLSPLDIVFSVLLLRTLATIKLSDVHTGGVDRRPPRAFAHATLISLAVILIWTVYGIGTGGSVANMLWQVRPLLMLPIVALVSSVAMARERCFRAVKLAILASGLLKVIDGSTYYFLRVRPLGLKADYVSTHSDTVLWSVCVAILMADWFEYRTKATRNRMVVVGLPIFFGMLINNRRTVWVVVAASTLFLIVQAHGPVKRQVAKVLGLTWPLIALYIVAGVAAPPSLAFKPVQMIKSVIVQDDASSSTRDIENFNLLQTLRIRPLVGVGFGHPYVEQIVAYDVTITGFKNYRYIPHNSFLGLWAFTGLFCAAGYHLMIPVGIYYAVWARRRSRHARRRSSGDWAVCAVIAYLIQSWSDIGLQDWTALILCAVGLGAGAALYQHVETELAEHDGGERPATRPVSASAALERQTQR